MRPILQNTESARYLIGVNDEKDLSHDPDIAAFRTEKQLSGAKAGELGGKTISWDEIMKKCKKLAAENDDSVDDPYSPLHMRQY